MTTILAILLFGFCLFISIQYGAGNDIPPDVNRWTGKSTKRDLEREEEELLLEKGRRYGK